MAVQVHTLLVGAERDAEAETGCAAFLCGMLYMARLLECREGRELHELETLAHEVAGRASNHIRQTRAEARIMDTPPGDMPQ